MQNYVNNHYNIDCGTPLTDVFRLSNCKNTKNTSSLPTKLNFVKAFCTILSVLYVFGCAEFENNTEIAVPRQNFEKFNLVIFFDHITFIKIKSTMPFEGEGWDVLSEEKILENGVPQGSTLSCTLFAIAINDICAEVDQNIQKCLYVDDLAIFYSATTAGAVTHVLQPAINTTGCSLMSCPNHHVHKGEISSDHSKKKNSYPPPLLSTFGLSLKEQNLVLYKVHTFDLSYKSLSTYEN
ncbi:hypothetical protein ABEB36_014609 [Hypothenemus hampei]|uniref:Reverse transcriptase domain-containing protein n=1 Tax=Hypothenemus hampei TaxID=57062 RepID=A0ABD1E2B2_HYPHA